LSVLAESFNTLLPTVLILQTVLALLSKWIIWKQWGGELCD